MQRAAMLAALVISAAGLVATAEAQPCDCSGEVLAELTRSRAREGDRRAYVAVVTRLKTLSFEEFERMAASGFADEMPFYGFEPSFDESRLRFRQEQLREASPEAAAPSSFSLAEQFPDPNVVNAFARCTERCARDSIGARAWVEVIDETEMSLELRWNRTGAGFERVDVAGVDTDSKQRVRSELASASKTPTGELSVPLHRSSRYSTVSLELVPARGVSFFYQLLPLLPEARRDECRDDVDVEAREIDELAPVGDRSAETAVPEWHDFDGDGTLDFVRVVSEKGSTRGKLLVTLWEMCDRGSVAPGRTIVHEIPRSDWYPDGWLDAGHPGGRAWIDVNDDGRVDYCRVVGELGRPTLACSLADTEAAEPRFVPESSRMSFSEREILARPELAEIFNRLLTSKGLPPIGRR